MKIDLQKGTVNFTKHRSFSQLASTLTPQVRTLIGFVLLATGMIFSYFLVLNPIHEFFHAVGAELTRGNAEIHHNVCITYGGNFTFIRLCGPYGELFFYIGIAIGLAKSLPEYSTFFIGYGIVATIQNLTWVHAGNDLYKMPVARIILLILLIVGIMIYLIKFIRGIITNIKPFSKGD